MPKRAPIMRGRVPLPHEPDLPGLGESCFLSGVVFERPTIRDAFSR